MLAILQRYAEVLLVVIRVSPPLYVWILRWGWRLFLIKVAKEYSYGGRIIKWDQIAVVFACGSAAAPFSTYKSPADIRYDSSVPLEDQMTPEIYAPADLPELLPKAFALVQFQVEGASNDRDFYASVFRANPQIEIHIRAALLPASAHDDVERGAEHGKAVGNAELSDEDEQPSLRNDEGDEEVEELEDGEAIFDDSDEEEEQVFNSLLEVESYTDSGATSAQERADLQDQTERFTRDRRRNALAFNSDAIFSPLCRILTLARFQRGRGDPVMASILDAQAIIRDTREAYSQIAGTLNREWQPPSGSTQAELIAGFWRATNRAHHARIELSWWRELNESLYIA